MISHYEEGHNVNATIKVLKKWRKVAWLCSRIKKQYIQDNCSVSHKLVANKNTFQTKWSKSRSYDLETMRWYRFNLPSRHNTLIKTRIQLKSSHRHVHSCFVRTFSIFFHNSYNRKSISDQ